MYYLTKYIQQFIDYIKRVPGFDLNPTYYYEKDYSIV